MPDTPRCELISWGEVARLCRRLAARLQQQGFRPDIIVAIGRGGYVPARLLCDALDLMALTGIRIEHYLSGSSRQARALIRYPLNVDVRGLRVLIVDDVNDSGDTLQLALEHVRGFAPREVRTAVMHDKAVSRFRVDFSARRIVRWRWLIYPWALNEDVSAFIERLPVAPATLAEAQAALARAHGLRISRAALRETRAGRRLPD